MRQYRHNKDNKGIDGYEHRSHRSKKDQREFVKDVQVSIYKKKLEKIKIKELEENET